MPVTNSVFLLKHLKSKAYNQNYNNIHINPFNGSLYVLGSFDLGFYVSELFLVLIESTYVEIELVFPSVSPKEKS